HMVLGLGCTFLGKGIVGELVVGGGVGLTSSLEGSGVLSLGCTLLGKGEEEVHVVEGKVHDGRGRVSQGDNR
ncbi:hypothetical protein KI387_001298, partial [Taxus chinensis]